MALRGTGKAQNKGYLKIRYKQGGKQMSISKREYEAMIEQFVESVSLQEKIKFNLLS